MKTLGIFGLFGGPNLGNEATLAAFLAEARRRLPGLQVRFIAPRGHYEPEAYGGDHVPMDLLPIGRYLWRLGDSRLREPVTAVAQVLTERRRRSRTWRQVRRLDHLVAPGTGIIDDFGQGPLDVPAHLERWCTAAERAGIPVSLISVGVSSAKHSWTRRLLARAVRATSYCSVRDQPSRRNLEALLGTGRAVHVYPDLAFGLRPEELDPCEPIRWPPLRIGLGVMGYFGWNRAEAAGERIYQAYLEKVTRQANDLLARGIEVRLLVGDTRADARPLSELAGALRGTLGGGLVVPEIRTWRDLWVEIGKTDLVIATRFHNVLLALLADRPVVSLGYSEKNAALMEAAGLAEYSQAVETFDAGWLRARMDGLVTAAEPPLKRARQLVLESRSLLARQYDVLFPPQSS